MTLVLPFCNSNQPVNGGQMKLPCVFDGEPLDFESALTESNWTTLKSISSVFEDECDTATPESCDRSPSCKRKFQTEGGESHGGDDECSNEAKKLCTDENAPPTSTMCESFQDIANCRSTMDCSRTEDDEDEEEPSSSSIEMQEDGDEEDMFLPRRRVPQMWNSRQRWKDERKKVLKMSVNKLTEIEDPELWLLRSVLINNTIKRLHQDIRNERQAKIRHRQQKIDFFNDQHHRQSSMSDCAVSSPFDDSSPSYKDLLRPAPSSDLYDDSSCDEIFGISEDFLRVTIPDRRVSSPVPTTDHNQADKNIDIEKNVDEEEDEEDDDDDGTSNMDVSSPPDTSTTDSLTLSSCSHVSNNAINRTQNLTLSSCLRSGSSGGQCSTQFRTNDVGSSSIDSVLQPRAPILDSVVYHSLLASLESS